MGTEDPKDLFKAAAGTSINKEPYVPTVIKRRPRRKFKEIPECYFLPRRSWPSAIAINGCIIAAGIGAGMLIETWIKKKVENVKQAMISTCLFWKYASQFHFGILAITLVIASGAYMFTIIRFRSPNTDRGIPVRKAKQSYLYPPVLEEEQRKQE